MSRRVLIGLPLAAALLLIVAAGSWLGATADATAPDRAPVQLAPGSDAGLTSLPADTPQEMLTVIMEQMGVTSLKARIGAPPKTASLTERDTPDDPGTPVEGLSLYVTYPAPDSSGGAVRDMWLANVIGGALNDRLKMSGRDPLRSIELVQRNPDGSEVPVGGGIGNTVTGQRFDDVSTDAIRQRAGAVARVVSVQARETTFQAVVEVVAAVADPDRLLRTASPEELLAAVFGETRRYEGFYLELRDEEGRPFLKLVASHEPGEMSRA